MDDRPSPVRTSPMTQPYSMGNLMSVAVFIGLVIAFVSCQSLFPWSTGAHGGKSLLYHKHFLELSCNVTIAKHLRELTAKPHVAGTTENFETADYVLSAFRRYGLDAHYMDYPVLLSYPLTKSLSMSLAGGHMNIQFDLKEVEEGDPRDSNAVPAFHAYSPSGSVAGKVVYVNYGRTMDFARLGYMGVDVKGAVVMARYGMIYRGDILKNAAEAGAVGALLYSDPRDCAGNGTGGYYPESMWLPPKGVQGGTVLQNLGDPLTPGWPSTYDSERLSVDDLGRSSGSCSSSDVLHCIPSMPISAENAHEIMVHLGGPVAPPEWHGALDLPTYRLGPGPGILNLTYAANMTVAPIRNVFAVIKGSEEHDRYVLLGNHRDAWTFGAVDPNSGTATLLELARRFGKLLKRGWRPRRTLILCSWDAEEYGSIGSTEWVEENPDLLKSQAVAYLNVDCAAAGPGFFASATPQLDQLVIETTKLVKNPDNHSQTLYESWVADSYQYIPLVGRLGEGGSDHASFVQHIGVPSIDIYFGKGCNYPVYHSIYDDFLWMSKFGDPFFQRHVAVAGVWGLIALKLADEEILPFYYDAYAAELKTYTKTLERQLKQENAPPEISTAPLHKSIAQLKKAAEQITEHKRESQAYGSGVLRQEQRSLNDRLLMAERAFTDSDGLPRNSWYKHLIYGPSKDNDYGWSPFPAISDSLRKAIISNTSRDWSDVQHQIWRVSRGITRVAFVLQGQLS